MVSKPIISYRGFRYALPAQAILVFLRVIEVQSALFGSLTITSITSVTGRPRLARGCLEGAELGVLGRRVPSTRRACLVG